jgi:glycosyltransferase involved in cell wall biosynthesis
MTAVQRAPDINLTDGIDLTDGVALVPSPVTAVECANPGPPSVSVVIPTLNEADNLGHVLPRIPGWVDEVIVVDGGSTDRTVELALALVPRARIVHQVGRGKGSALTQGCRAATGDIVVMLDADGSTDPAEIPRFVAALRTGADFAKGTRFVAGGGSADITSLRRLGNAALVGTVNLLWRTRYSDLCYGYIAVWRDKLELLSVDCVGFEVETLLNIRAVTAGLKVAEVPSFEKPRLHGVSNLSAHRDGLRVLRTIVAEWIRP